MSRARGKTPLSVGDYIWDAIDRELRPVTKADTEWEPLPYAVAADDCELWHVPSEVRSSPEAIATYLRQSGMDPTATAEEITVPDV